MSTHETFAEWLARTVAEDDPANGGQGILTIGDCEKCEGLGIVEHVGSRVTGKMRLIACEKCDGTGNVKDSAENQRT